MLYYRLMLTIGCPMAFQDYPMDQQVCNLEMQSCKQIQIRNWSMFSKDEI